LTILLAFTGCGGDGPPPVSGSRTQATVHGSVTYKGRAVPGGTIRFDPTNINRRDAQIATSPIGKDGGYKVTTLVGENAVRFEFPADMLKANPRLATFEKQHDVPSGDSTLDVDLPQ
jgi:hypothetical protein